MRGNSTQINNPRRVLNKIFPISNSASRPENTRTLRIKIPATGKQVRRIDKATLLKFLYVLNVQLVAKKTPNVNAKWKFITAIREQCGSKTFTSKGKSTKATKNSN